MYTCTHAHRVQGAVDIFFYFYGTHFGVPFSLLILELCAIMYEKIMYMYMYAYMYMYGMYIYIHIICTCVYVMYIRIAI